MDATMLRTQFLSRLNDGMEIVQINDGFIVWLPLTYSDDDAVCLAVKQEANGWRVSDQGSTLARLHAMTDGIGGERFTQAWDALSLPGTGFVPGELAEGVIAAWGDESNVGEMIQRVAQAALRSEGLSWLTRSTSRVRFGDRVTQRVRRTFDELHVGELATIRTNSPLKLTSGRTRKVTATVERDGRPVVAVQAVGGSSNETRERSFEHCYATFGPAEIASDRRLAVAVGSRDAWSKYLVRELREICDVVFFDEPGTLEKEFAELLASENLLPA